MVDFFNSQIEFVHDESNLDKDPRKISWSDVLVNRWKRHQKIDFQNSSLSYIMYRPFTKKWVNNLRPIIHRPRFWNEVLPKNNDFNLFLNLGSGIKFSPLVTDTITDYQFLFNAKTIPLYYSNKHSRLREDFDLNISSYWEEEFASLDDIFYYVYAILHSRNYRSKYANDLQKSLPRIPLLKNKETYVEIGRKLSNLHLKYEEQPSFYGVEVEMSKPDYRVKKMKHPKKSALDAIIYNESITIKNIPVKAYDYVVNGRPAIEWIIDQYQVKTDKKSGITDDPNNFSDDPKYILNLLLSVITVSMRTLELIDELPPFEVTV